MSYHPALEALLDTPEIRAIKQMPLPQQREIFEKFVVEKQKEIPKPDIIEKDIPLENGTFFRHYSPRNKSDKVILFIHGGGWSLGSVNTYNNICRYLCDTGNFQVFSLEYRLAPEHVYPAAVQDSLAAYDWLYSNAADLGFAKEDIFVMGDSAGGNLATIICHERQEDMPKAQVLLYPAVDMFRHYESNAKFDEPKYHLTMPWCNMFLDAYVTKKKQLKEPMCSPIYYEGTKQPDTLIIAVTHDILVGGIYAYEQKLKNEGVNVETHYDDEMYHGFVSAIGLIPLPNPKIALDKAIQYINKR